MQVIKHLSCKRSCHHYTVAIEVNTQCLIFNLFSGNQGIWGSSMESFGLLGFCYCFFLSKLTLQFTESYLLSFKGLFWKFCIKFAPQMCYLSSHNLNILSVFIYYWDVYMHVYLSLSAHPNTIIDDLICSLYTLTTWKRPLSLQNSWCLQSSSKNIVGNFCFGKPAIGLISHLFNKYYCVSSMCQLLGTSRWIKHHSWHIYQHRGTQPSSWNKCTNK